MGSGAYTAQILKTTTSTSVGVGSIANPGSTRRLLLLEFLCGSDAATLGTSSLRWELQRSTTQGSGTASFVNPIDGHTLTGTELPPAGLNALLSNLTANGTLTSGAILLTIPLAEPATFRWIANPGYELVIPATTNAGIHFMTPVCGGNPSVAAQVTFDDR